MSATFWWPVWLNVAAARIRMAALMKNANRSATVESSVAKRMASRFDAASGSTFRVCTIEEWRYRLWGITVAPRMPMAM